MRIFATIRDRLEIAPGSGLQRWSHTRRFQGAMIALFLYAATETTIIHPSYEYSIVGLIGCDWLISHDFGDHWPSPKLDGI